MIDAIQFSSFAEFLDMGGYAFNVWSVYFLFAVFITTNLLLPKLKRKQILRELQRRATLDAEKQKLRPITETSAVTGESE